MVTNIQTAVFQYSYTIGRSELAGEGLRNPVAVARDSGNRLYIINRSTDYSPIGKRVTICTVDEEYVGEFGKGVIFPEDAEAAADLGALLWPAAITLDRDDNVYIADESLNWISAFSKEGGFLFKWGGTGSADGELNGPAGLAFGPAVGNEENLYVADTLNHRIQVFNREGGFLAKWGRQGRNEGEFDMPWGIDVDGQGNVYVADWSNHRMQKFAPDGQFLMRVGSLGSGEGQLDHPSSVAVDKEGIIYVADWGNERLQIFDPDGEFLAGMAGDATVSQWGKKKLDANREMWQQRTIAKGLEREKLFLAPIAVDVDDTGRIFVVDPGRDRIQVYRKLPATYLSVRLGG